MLATGTSHPRAARRPLRSLLGSDWAAVVLAGALALAVGPPLLRGPSSVEQVSIVNRSEYTVTVDVRGDGGGWMSLNTIGEESTKTTADVLDQGDVWTFRFRAQGHHAGEVAVTRADLADAGWSLAVPDHVVAHLRRVGAPPSP